MDLVGPPNPQTVRQVHEALSARRDLAYTTVMNVLQRLAPACQGELSPLVHSKSA